MIVEPTSCDSEWTAGSAIGNSPAGYNEKVGNHTQKSKKIENDSSLCNGRAKQ
jgi:hypothetical protein